MTFDASLLMIPREMPNLLQVAYALRYAKVPLETNPLTRALHTATRMLTLIKELTQYQSTEKDYEQNRKKLRHDFKLIKKDLLQNQKPICVYFVSTSDHEGSILGNQIYYYHHYKIQNLQKYFAVAPKLVSSQEEMKAFITRIKKLYPSREISFVDIVCHGSESSLHIHPRGGSITPKQLDEDLFKDVAQKGTILIDACMTGLGNKNIADEIARKTPGRTVLAPGPNMFFSKPIIQIEDDIPRVVSAVHGFAILHAFTCNAFTYQEKMPSQYQ